MFFSVIALNSSCVGTNGLNCRGREALVVYTEASKSGAFLASSAFSIQSSALLLNFYLYSRREKPARGDVKSNPPLPVHLSAGAAAPHQRRERTVEGLEIHRAH